MLLSGGSEDWRARLHIALTCEHGIHAVTKEGTVKKVRERKRKTKRPADIEV